MESAPTVLNRPPPPFPAPPRTVDFSALEFILGLIAVISIPALIYAFFFTIKCPPNPFSRSRRSSTDSVPSISGDTVSAADDGDTNKENKDPVSNIKFSKDKHVKDVGGDCTVCLAEFVDGDDVKLLSACKHSFHATCIDTWFKSQPNCPVCRNPVAVAVKRPENRSGNGGGGGESDRQQGLPDAANLV